VASQEEHCVCEGFIFIGALAATATALLLTNLRATQSYWDVFTLSASHTSSTLRPGSGM